MSDFKQAIIVREDLGMSKGKMIAQACHASLGAYKKVAQDERDSWEDSGSKKIVLDSGNSELTELHERSKKMGLPSFLVRDAGMTELEPGTKTAVAVGPAEEDKIDTITGELELIE